METEISIPEETKSHIEMSVASIRDMIKTREDLIERSKTEPIESKLVDLAKREIISLERQITQLTK